MTSRIDLKVVLLGREFCGKTSLANRFLNDKFNHSASAKYPYPR